MSYSTVKRLIEEKEGEILANLLPRLFEEEGTVTGVARRLGIERKTLYRWMEDEGIQLDRSTVVRQHHRPVAIIGG